MNRIGLGYDRHRLVVGRPFLLGGVRIPHTHGPLGHSDGDALLHALTDAVLGAAGLDDLGSLYSDKDPQNAGRDSADFARDASARVKAAGFRIVSLDAVVIVELPRIGPRRAEIRQRISELFEVALDAVNVKGKSGEGFAPIATGELIEVHAVALLERVGR